MCVKEQYGIVFSEQLINNITYNSCMSNSLDFGNLSFISRLDVFDTTQIINDLNSCVTNKFNISDSFESDSIENLFDIEYRYPNVTINNIETIPMTDLKELLQEWLVFIGK